ncbi:hypothetical protein CPB86DRAFT_76433 [Serendipita vermifera]|nr:hypothetical protein CPB86DRAFT_76433 [Serendipita vermifera]
MALEQRFRRDKAVVTTLKTFKAHELCGILQLMLLSEPPLMPLNEEEVSRYSKSGIPKENIQAIFGRVKQEHAPIVNRLLLRTYQEFSMFWPIFVLLTHRASDEMGQILQDVRSKWDFKKNQCLPSGYRRSWVGGRPQYLLDGRPYYPPP